MKPLRISIHALGGQGGGVLSDWVVDLAEHCGWIAQATSVPGVAQRTGATVYYIEIAQVGGAAEPEPVLALMPTPGDVDVVIAAELMEAGRAMARGLVTRDRTTLIASSHRVFAIGEKSALGDGIISPASVLQAAAKSARRLVLADFGHMAEANDSVISAAMFGALGGSEALPFPREAYEIAIHRSGKGVEASLRAFSAGFAMARLPPSVDAPESGETARPRVAVSPRLRVATLPAAAQAYATLGVERLTDYQGRAYAALYADRLDAIARADRELGGVAEGFALTTAAARHLALWMSFEDVIRVADLKSRRSRLVRVRDEASAAANQVVHATEFMHPRYEEVCDLMPDAIGRRMLGSMRGRRLFARFLDRGRLITTTRLPGFLLLWTIARLRGYRPRSLRYGQEQARIAVWLENAVNAARTDYRLGVEVLRLQRLVKGYGDTHARGLANFSLIVGKLPNLVGRLNAAGILAGLHEAALEDDEGTKLRRTLSRLERQTEPARVE